MIVTGSRISKRGRRNIIFCFVGDLFFRWRIINIRDTRERQFHRHCCQDRFHVQMTLKDLYKMKGLVFGRREEWSRRMDLTSKPPHGPRNYWRSSTTENETWQVKRNQFDDTNPKRRWMSVCGRTIVTKMSLSPFLRHSYTSGWDLFLPLYFRSVDLQSFEGQNRHIEVRHFDPHCPS